MNHCDEEDTADVVDNKEGGVARIVELVSKGIVGGYGAEVEHVLIYFGDWNRVKSNQREQQFEEIHHFQGVIQSYKEHVEYNWKTDDTREYLVEESLQKKIYYQDKDTGIGSDSYQSLHWLRDLHDAACFLSGDLPM